MEKIITDIPDEKLNFLIKLLKMNGYKSDFDFTTTITKHNTCLRLNEKLIMGIAELEIYKDWYGDLTFIHFNGFIRTLKINNICRNNEFYNY